MELAQGHPPTHSKKAALDVRIFIRRKIKEMQHLLQSTLMYLAAAYPLISYFKPSKVNAKSTYMLAAIMVLLGAVKLGTDIGLMPENYYVLLDSQRHFSGFNIRFRY